MTTTYESIDPASTVDTTYTRIEKPRHDYENVENTR